MGLVAATNLTVLIRGEPGTGRTLVARVIHRHSRRADQPLVQVDCAGFPEDRLYLELFGDPQGTFTDSESQRIGCLRKANHGTLFLHDIGHLGPIAQARLLGVSHDAAPQGGGGGGGVAGLDVRVLAAIDPRREAAMREDLYHRLSDFVIALPPLRERLEDIPELVTDFMKRYAGHGGTFASMILTPDAMEYLQQQRWPGNVRQLRNVLGNALSLACGDAITRRMLEGLLKAGSVAED
jgi:DNA-binding NtrC family response regulator